MSTSDEKNNPAVRCVLVPLVGVHLLLPSSCLAEIVNYQPPQPQNDAPAWLQGTIDWRGETIPLVAVETLLGLEHPVPGHRSRIAVCSGLSTDSTLAYYGILANSVPRQARITAENIAAMDPMTESPLAKQWVQATTEQAVIPDLDGLEAEIQQILAA